MTTLHPHPTPTPLLSSQNSALVSSGPGAAVSVSPDGTSVLSTFGSNGLVYVLSPNGGGVSGFSSTGTLPLPPSVTAGFGLAHAIARNGWFTAVSASGVGPHSSGLVFIYSAGSPAISSTPSPSATPSTTPSQSPVGVSSSCGVPVTFNYSGTLQFFQVPLNVTWVSVFMWGAGGVAGGAGAFVSGNLSVAPGETLRIIIGASGNAPLSILTSTAGGNGGYGVSGSGGGRSAVQRIYPASHVACLASGAWAGSALYLSELVPRGIAGGYFSDIVTAAGGGSQWSSYTASAGSGSTQGLPASSWAGQRVTSSDATGHCRNANALLACPTWPYTDSNSGGAGGGWCGGVNAAGDNTGSGSGGTSWSAALHNGIGVNGSGAVAGNPSGPYYQSGVGNAGSNGLVVLLPLCSGGGGEPSPGIVGSLWPLNACPSPSTSGTESASPVSTQSQTRSPSVTATASSTRTSSRSPTQRATVSTSGTGSISSSVTSSETQSLTQTQSSSAALMPSGTQRPTETASQSGSQDPTPSSSSASTTPSLTQTQAKSPTTSAGPYSIVLSSGAAPPWNPGIVSDGLPTQTLRLSLNRCPTNSDADLIAAARVSCTVEGEDLPLVYVALGPLSAAGALSAAVATSADAPAALATPCNSIAKADASPLLLTSSVFVGSFFRSLRGSAVLECITTQSSSVRPAVCGPRGWG